MNKNNWLDKMEAKLGNLAIEGLMRYVAMIMLTVFVLRMAGKLSYSHLYLNGAAILSGQAWRAITFLFIPLSNHPIMLIFELMIIVMCADGIEAAMGSFKLTAYYILGAVFTVIASLIAPNLLFDSHFMYLSLFFGYATLYPNQELLFMFIIPVKIKYLAYFSGLATIAALVTASWGSRLAILVAIANYLVFFAIPAAKGVQYQYKQKKRREAFEKEAASNKEYRHKCSICGKTEVTNPELLFKYCTCKVCGENGIAFCPEHLKEHKERLQKKETS